MPEWLYPAGDNGLWVFLLLTVTLGGAATFATGKALAETWRPVWQLPVYCLLLAAGVRFLHFALFEEEFLAPQSFLVDLIVLGAAGITGLTLARARAMARQYPWLAARPD